MASRDPSDPDVVDPLTDDPLAFLYEPGDEDEDEDSTADNPSYGSLMGLAVRRDGAPMKPAKVMAIVLDELEAQRAHEVMEINAGQLMTNPDRSSREVGFGALGLDASAEEEDEDELAESLTWETGAEDDDADWQPENPLAGTGMEQPDEDDDPDWRPENPLAGTGFEEADEDDDPAWASQDPPADTNFAEAQEWSVPADEPVEAPPAQRGVNGFADEAYAEEAWAEPSPPAEPPMREEPAPEDEQARPVAAAPIEEEARFEDVEWELPSAVAADGAAAPIEAEAGFDAPPEAPELAAIEEGLAEYPVEPPVGNIAADEEAGDDDDESALAGTPPIEWQALLGKKRTKEPALPPPIDWGEFAAGEDPAEDPAEADYDWGTPTPEPAAAEPDWQAFAAEEAAEAAPEPFEPEWREEAGEDSEETLPAASFEETIQAEFEPEFQPSSSPERIEIVRFPAPPAVEPTHHSIRARVLKVHPPRTPPRSRIKPVLRWIAARFENTILPLLKRLFARAKEKWAEIASRPPRD